MPPTVSSPPYLGGPPALASPVIFADQSTYVVSSTGQANLRYNNSATALQVSVNGGAYSSIPSTASITLQQAYAGGPTIATTTVLGPVIVGNANNDTNNSIEITKTGIAASGAAAYIASGVATTGAAALWAQQSGSGPVIHVQQSGAGNGITLGTASTGDVGVTRSAAGVLSVTNGSTGAGALLAASISAVSGTSFSIGTSANPLVTVYVGRGQTNATSSSFTFKGTSNSTANVIANTLQFLGGDATGSGQGGGVAVGGGTGGATGIGGDLYLLGGVAGAAAQAGGRISLQTAPAGAGTATVDRLSLTATGSFQGASATVFGWVSSAVDSSGTADTQLKRDAAGFVGVYGSGSTYGTLQYGTSINLRSGAGSPEGAVTASVGAMYSRSDGASATTLYVKTSGASNTGWEAVTAGSTGLNGITNTTTGQLQWNTGSGAISHLLGPSDQTFTMVGGSNQSVLIAGGATSTGTGKSLVLNGGTTSNATSMGGDANLVAGDGATSGAGGDAKVQGGVGGSTGNGGIVRILGGAAGVTSGNGGGVLIQTGTVTTSGNAGALSILGQSAQGGNNVGTTITVTAGNSVGSGTGGAVTVTAGRSGTGTAGAMTLTAGAGGTTSGDGGIASLIGGAGGTGNANGGVARVVGGAGIGTLVGGAAQLTGGAGGATGAGGACTITSGAGGATSGNSGALTLATGTVTSGTVGSINFNPGGVNAWTVNASGHLLAGTDATYDIGAAGATRPRNLYTSAGVYGPVPVTVTSGAVAVSANVSGTVYANSAAFTPTLPSAAAGYVYTFMVQNASALTITANTGDTIRLAGTVSAAAGTCVSSTVGDVITLIAIDATQWIAQSIIGTWVVT